MCMCVHRLAPWNKSLFHILKKITSTAADVEIPLQQSVWFESFGFWFQLAGQCCVCMQSACLVGGMRHQGITWKQKSKRHANAAGYIYKHLLLLTFTNDLNAVRYYSGASCFTGMDGYLHRQPETYRTQNTQMFNDSCRTNLTDEKQ